MKILVTGGAGLIGSALIRYRVSGTDNEVIKLEKDWLYVDGSYRLERLGSSA